MMSNEDLAARVAALEKNHLVLLGRHNEHEEAMAQVGATQTGMTPSLVARVDDLERRIATLEASFAGFVRRLGG